MTDTVNPPLVPRRLTGRLIDMTGRSGLFHIGLPDGDVRAGTLKIPLKPACGDRLMYRERGLIVMAVVTWSYDTTDGFCTGWVVVERLVDV